MGGQPAPSVPGQKGRLPARLLNPALVLAVISAILHLYIGVAIYGIPLGVPLILVALVYLGGTGMIIANYRRSLWLKIAPAWVSLVLILWALSAAVNAVHTRDLLSYFDKAIELVLLGLLLVMRRFR